YFTWLPRAAFLLAALTLIAFVAARWVERAKQRGDSHAGGAGTGVTILLATCLCAFKIALLTPEKGIAGMVMPLGISYYTFKLISYVLDVEWGKIPASSSLLEFAAYVAFFPQIVAGPIQRPGSFFADIDTRPGSTAEALSRLAFGLIKKLLIADNLASLVNSIYSQVTSLSGAPLWVGFYLFPLQMYADFSGLTDIAIGIGLLFGIRGPENFNRPFTATSIGDFWRRWHMSLTSWLADYVFVPLRMATRRAGNLGLGISIAVNMTAIGLWHGLTWTYLVFGLLNAAFLVVDVLTGRTRTRFFKRHPEWNGIASALGWLLTFHLIMIAEVFFRARNLPDAIWFLGHLAAWPFDSVGRLSVLIADAGVRGLAIGVAGYVVMELAERYRPDLSIAAHYLIWPRWVRWSIRSTAVTLAIVGLALLVATSGGERSPFLYEIF
ncbi:MAG: hypothetical protein JWN34_170, partial [Bryobacterales bacterium]|nr:hypothetical protein [Bryobacterales bacterium]